MHFWVAECHDFLGNLRVGIAVACISCHSSPTSSLHRMATSSGGCQSALFEVAPSSIFEFQMRYVREDGGCGEGG